MKDSLKIAIAGATGYVGLELLKILSKHPRVKVLYLCAQKSIGKKAKIYLPKKSSHKKRNEKKYLKRDLTSQPYFIKKNPSREYPNVRKNKNSVIGPPPKNPTAKKCKEKQGPPLP